MEAVHRLKSVCEVTHSLSRGQIPDTHKSAHDLQLISWINFCTMGKSSYMELMIWDQLLNKLLNSKKHKRFSPLNQMCYDSKLHSSKTIITKLRKQNLCKRQAIKFSNSALKINVFTCLIRHWSRNALKSFGVKDCKAKQEDKSSDLGLVFGCEFLPWEQQDRAAEFLEWQHTGTAA